MKHVVRTTLLALAVVAAAGSAPASASPGAGHGGGSGGAGCWGCGVSNGSAQVTYTGYYRGYLAVNAPAVATFTINESPATCPVMGTATGVMTGAINVSFAWTRVGGAILMSTTGDVNGASVLAIVPTNNVTNPCGGVPLSFALQGPIVGT